MPPASGPAKVKVRRVKPPAGDVASSGGNYGTRQAKRAATSKPVVRAIRKVYDAQPVARRKQIVRNATGPVAKAIAPIHAGRVNRAQEIAHSQAQHDVPAADLAVAHRYLAAHPEILKPPKKSGGTSFLGVASNAIADVAAPALKPAALAIDTAFGTHLLPATKKGISNVPADTAELAVSTPSSLAKLATTTVQHPEKVPGMLAAPYKELYQHPGKFLVEHPVTTALMLDPAIKMPGRIVGKAARVTGKQTLERTTATLPGTALKIARTGSRDYVVRRAQARADVKAGPRKVTMRQVQKRVDEAFGAQQKHGERVRAAIARDTKVQAKALPKDQRAQFVADQRSIAGSAAKSQAQVAFAREFGATAYRTPDGVIVKPKQATEGVLHATQEDAQAVADALNRKAPVLAHGGFTKAEKILPTNAGGKLGLTGNQPVPVKFVVSKVGDKHAVIPDFVSERLQKHKGVGTSKAPGAKLLRQSRGMFTRAVLPYRPTWLTGQAVEGVVRNTVMGAGPTSFLRARKVVGAMERHDPGSGKALLDRAVPAGKIGKVMKEFAGESNTLANEFPGNPIAHSLTALGKTPGIKQVRDLHHAISTAVFTHVNARFLEGLPQTAMLGKALKNSPLMEKSIIGLSDKAIEDAAKGLRETHAQVELARAVQRAYGKYSNFGPGLREAIVHWTPFIPWTLNAARFLGSVLPKDHPIMQAMIADAGVAEQDWRKAHRLSMRSLDQLPFFDQGGYPTNGGNSVLRIGHYTPWGAAVDPTGGLANMVLPQFTGAYGALKYGLDWKGKPLRHADGKKFSPAETWLYGLQQLGEAMIPVSQQIDNVAHAKHPLRAIRKELRVMSSTQVKPNKAKPASTGWGSPSSGSSGWGSPSTSTGWG